MEEKRAVPAIAIDYSGKTVVITGATGAIGLGFCRAFADAGANVIAAGATAADVEAAGTIPGVRFTVLDVRSDDAVATFADGVTEADVLLNGAGVNLRAAEHTPDEAAAAAARRAISDRCLPADRRPGRRPRLAPRSGRCRG